MYRPRLCTPSDMKRFHTDDYIDFLSKITPDKEVSAFLVHAFLAGHAALGTANQAHVPAGPVHG